MSDLDREAVQIAFAAYERTTEYPYNEYALEAAITAYLAAMSEKGFRMMPRQPTSDMLNACRPYQHISDGGTVMNLQTGKTEKYSTAYTIQLDRIAWFWRTMFDSFANSTDAVSQTATEQNPNQHGGGET